MKIQNGREKKIQFYSNSSNERNRINLNLNFRYSIYFSFFSKLPPLPPKKNFFLHVFLFMVESIINIDFVLP